ncbi:MAG: class IV adenylate cyclase [Planctomycetota bacterium]
MPLEIEIKLRIADDSAVRRALQARGARHVWRVLETDRILDTPERRLRAAGCALRVRTSRPAPPQAGADVPSALLASTAEATMLAFKGPRSPGDFKQREEIEVGVADAEALLDILGRLGCAPVIVLEKLRERWDLAGCQVLLDELPGLGRFVEIEGPDAGAIERVRSALWLDAAPLVRETYVEMAARHGSPDSAGCTRLVFAPAPGGSAKAAEQE